MTAEAPTAAPTTEAPTSSPGGGPCNAQVITAALPSGSKVLSFDCANVSGTQWAAVKVDPGPTVFFLQRNGSNWDVSMGDEICGTASAGLPEKLLAYCSDSGTGSDMSMSPGSDMDMSTDSSVAPS